MRLPIQAKTVIRSTSTSPIGDAVGASGCDVFKAIGCAAALAACAAACAAGPATCLSCLGGLGAAGCADCL